MKHIANKEGAPHTLCGILDPHCTDPSMASCDECRKLILDKLQGQIDKLTKKKDELMLLWYVADRKPTGGL